MRSFLPLWSPEGLNGLWGLRVGRRLPLELEGRDTNSTCKGVGGRTLRSRILSSLAWAPCTVRVGRTSGGGRSTLDTFCHGRKSSIDVSVAVRDVLEELGVSSLLRHWGMEARGLNGKPIGGCFAGGVKVQASLVSRPADASTEGVCCTEPCFANEVLRLVDRAREPMFQGRCPGYRPRCTFGFGPNSGRARSNV